MTEDWITALERRVSLIEAFLDAEARESQQLPQLNSTSCGAPINPWYGASGLASSINTKPIGISPVVPKCALGDTEP